MLYFDWHLTLLRFLQGIFNLFVLLAINELVPWSIPLYLYSLNFLAGFFDAICFWMVDDLARMWLRETWYFFRIRFQVEEDDDDTDRTVVYHTALEDFTASEEKESVHVEVPSESNDGMVASMSERHVRLDRI